MSTVKAAGKVLRVIKAMRGHSLSGVSIKQLSEQLGEPASQVHRALQTLIDEGFAKQEPNGLYTIGTAMVQIATSHYSEIERAKARIAEVEQRTSINIIY
ncbi:helix-turn-helix domain-containing protein [Acinetobacter puyangensis]|uniref:helix-turn-helix domain-containing protein n=1 Tax=Acinetobacter puyangensis TaxID=1096779 RepID=UPI003A4DEFAB